MLLDHEQGVAGSIVHGDAYHFVRSLPLNSWNNYMDKVDANIILSPADSANSWARTRRVSIIYSAVDLAPNKPLTSLTTARADKD